MRYCVRVNPDFNLVCSSEFLIHCQGHPNCSCQAERQGPWTSCFYLANLRIFFLFPKYEIQWEWKCENTAPLWNSLWIIQNLAAGQQTSLISFADTIRLYSDIVDRRLPVPLQRNLSNRRSAVVPWQCCINTNTGNKVTQYSHCRGCNSLNYTVIGDIFRFDILRPETYLIWDTPRL